MRSCLKIVKGPASTDEEHIALSYGSFSTDGPPFSIIARVSPPQDGVIMLQLLIDDSTTHNAEIIANVRRQIHWLFLEKGEANPLGYARHHCTTAANVYSDVHRRWVSVYNSTGGQRFK